MPGGTLVVSREILLFPLYKKQMEAFGFKDVTFTEVEKDGLNMIINERKPEQLLVGSRFYEAATPCMMGQLLKHFLDLHLNITVINTQKFPVKFAPFFIWRGVTSYVDFHEGWDEFSLGMEEIRKGHKYISPTVNKLVNGVEWPELNDKADKRQMEVLIFLCNGIKPEMIAEKLHVSRKTVDWHIEELFKTFDVQSREELISLAFYLEIVTKDDLCFFDRKKKGKPLPKWAEVKQRTSNNEQRTGNKWGMKEWVGRSKSL